MGMFRNIAPPPGSLSRATAAASAYFGEPITRAWLSVCAGREDRRKRFFIAAWLRWYDPMHWSYPKIASAIGLGDHTSVIYAEARALELYPDAEFMLSDPPGRAVLDLPRCPVPFTSALPVARINGELREALT